MATNKANGKAYIGQTIRPLYDRKSDHHLQAKNYSDSMPFHRAIRKYGKQGFTWRCLEDGVPDIESLNKLEAAYIAKHKTLSPNGYNLQHGGQNGLHSEATKAKMSRAHKDRERPAVSIGALVTYSRVHVAAGNHKPIKQSDSLRLCNGVPARKTKLRAGSRAIWAAIYKTIYHSDARNEAKILNRITGRKSPLAIAAQESMAKRYGKKIRCIETGEVYQSINGASKILGIGAKRIREVLNGKRMRIHVHGKSFEYV